MSDEPIRPPRKSSIEPPHVAPTPQPEPSFAEADLLNLGMPSSNTQAPPASANLDIFGSSSSQAEAASSADSNNDLLGGFGAFTSAAPPTTPIVNEPVTNDLLFGQTNGKPGDMSDLLFGQGGQSAPRPTPTADDLFDPFGSSGKDNLLGDYLFLRRGR